VKRVGRELGVRYVLDGSEQRTAKRVRVNVRLVDAASAAHVWADQFDVESGDLFQMQDTIVARLARVLHIELAEAEAGASRRRDRFSPLGRIWPSVLRRSSCATARTGPKRRPHILYVKR
jgi:hypothetical protein